MLVHQFLERSAARLPLKTALVTGGERWTYKDLDKAADRLAQALVKTGLQRGDRVVVYLPNCAEAVISIFAILKAGGVFVVINPTTRLPKLLYILNNCQAAAIISAPGQVDVQPVFAGASSVKAVFLTKAAAGAELPPGVWLLPEILSSSTTEPLANECIDLDLACLIYTSGSTGEPKGVMSDHSNVDFATGSIIQYLENREEDIVINLLPLSFDYGLYQLLMTFKFGGTLILEKGFLFPAAVLKRMADEKVTGFPGVPTIFAVLLQMDLSGYDLSSIRYITNTAAALPVSHILALRQKFPWARLYSMYGLTETKRTLYLPPEELERRPGSVGIAIPGTEVWLEDEQGNRLQPGSTGELVVRGRHVMRGYWNDPEMTAKRYKPGKLPGERVCYSGDLFRMDEEGFLYFVSRKDDIIKSKGEKVSPVEVERVLYDLPGVLEAAVIGIPDPVLGQAIKAFVVTKDPAIDEGAVMRHCRSRLEDFMLPRTIEFRDQLPKTESGKIKKTGLS